jgi:hypothetical protein
LGCPETGHVDHLRGLTRFLDTSRAVVGDITETQVELCPGALVYSITLSAHVFDETDPVPDIVAILQLQDSTIELPSYGCKIAEIRADLPGLAWPAFARLKAPAGVFVTLQVFYGHCA